MTLEGKTLSLVLPNATTEFSFLDDITVSKDATYIVARDAYFENTFPIKKAPLNEGDNVFYIFVTNGNDTETYTVNIRRKLVYTVSFDFNGAGAISEQKVEEGDYAVKPDDISHPGYDIDWDYDFSQPITSNICINAQWTVEPELENFVFISNGEGITITGLKDETITEIVIPDSVTSIRYSAFSNCDSLTSVVIGDSVTSIGEYAFSNCDSLTSVVIPDSVMSIGGGAFFGCTSLTSIKYCGTEAQWNAISKRSRWNEYYSNGSYYLINYTMTYNYTED